MPDAYLGRRVSLEVDIPPLGYLKLGDGRPQMSLDAEVQTAPFLEDGASVRTIVPIALGDALSIDGLIPTTPETLQLGKLAGVSGAGVVDWSGVEAGVDDASWGPFVVASGTVETPWEALVSVQGAWPAAAAWVDGSIAEVTLSNALMTLAVNPGDSVLVVVRSLAQAAGPAEELIASWQGRKPHFEIGVELGVNILEAPAGATYLRLTPNFAGGQSANIAWAAAAPRAL